MKVLLQFILLCSLAISVFAETPNSWPEAMLAVRKENISKGKKYREAEKKLGLAGLKLSPWYFLEFRLYGKHIKEPIFNYTTDAEKRFMADGKIDLKADYESTIKANKKINSRRFKRIGLKDSAVWTKHSLHRNHVESFYRTITADKARTQPLYLGFSEGCKVYLNGKSLGILWAPPYRIDIADAAKQGRNKLVVEVANTWSNRLVGDTKLLEDKRFCRTNMTHSLTWEAPWAETPLLESGLLGPVRLVAARTVSIDLP